MQRTLQKTPELSRSSFVRNHEYKETVWQGVFCLFCLKFNFHLSGVCLKKMVPL